MDRVVERLKGMLEDFELDLEYLKEYFVEIFVVGAIVVWVGLLVFTKNDIHGTYEKDTLNDAETAGSLTEIKISRRNKFTRKKFDAERGIETTSVYRLEKTSGRGSSSLTTYEQDYSRKLKTEMRISREYYDTDYNGIQRILKNLVRDTSLKVKERKDELVYSGNLSYEEVQDHHKELAYFEVLTDVYIENNDGLDYITINYEEFYE